MKENRNRLLDDKKKRNILITIVLLIGIITIIGVSYALWVLNLTQTGQNDIVSSCFNITFTDKDNISLQKAYPILDEEGKKLTPYEFTITNTCDSYASFNVNLEVLNTTTLTNNDAVKVMISSKTGDAETEINTNLLSSYQTTTKTLDNAKTAFNLTTGYLNAKESKTYTLRLWLDENVGMNTEGVQNAKFSSKVVVTTSYIEEIPSYCELNPNEATCQILSLAKNANTSSTDVITVLDKTSDSCTYTLAYDGTSDNNLRYVGANPCNYVKIDNEYWRIIGLMNNIDDGTGKKETRIKLIRNESIGEYSWDTSQSSVNKGYGVNEWSQADLMKLLNPGYESESIGGSLYYNSVSGKCYSSNNNGTKACDFTNSGLKTNLKSLIGDTLWSTGTNGTNDYKLPSNGLVSQFYSYERSSNTGKICSSGTYCNDTVERTTTWNGKIGLMYPSDYGYATSGGSRSNRTSCLNKELYNWDSSSYSDCKNNDWLYNSSNMQWTLSPIAYSSYSSYVFDVNFPGCVNNAYAGSAGLVRPSVYLVPSTSILGGEGTESNPYILSGD